MKKLLILILSLCACVTYAQVTTVNVGSSVGSNTGEQARSAFIKLNQNDFNSDMRGNASGTDTYTVTISAPSPGYTTGITALSSYVTGQRFFITFTNANTGAATLNVNSIGARSIVKNSSTALVAGDIKAGQTYELYYDGTNLKILGAAPEVRSYGTFCSDLTTAITSGTNKGFFTVPYAFTVTGVSAELLTAGTSGSILTIDINEGGTSILSTKLTVDNNETTSSTAATAPVISDASIAAGARITIDFDQVPTGAAGVLVRIYGYHN